MAKRVNFKEVYHKLKELLDRPTPEYRDFDSWRLSTYEDGRDNLPLKTWWPKYTDGDYRLELCLGALLIQQITWPSTRKCIENLRDYLQKRGKAFSAAEIERIDLPILEQLIRPGRFAKTKSRRIHKLCRIIRERGGIDYFFSNRKVEEFGKELQSLKSGFGPETRDCVLLYAANFPVFIADQYSRTLLQRLTGVEYDYNSCRDCYSRGIARDFSPQDLNNLLAEYTAEELNYALCNNPKRDKALVLLYQQFHAAIDELAIAKLWHLFE